MPEYMLLMHNDTQTDENAADWEGYIGKLLAAGVFGGGSQIGAGACFRKAGSAGPLAAHLSGFLRIRAADMAGATAALTGNPTYEAGGTVEIRELPAD